jgi:hypothetical protein
MVAATYGFVSAFGQNIALIPTLTTGRPDILHSKQSVKRNSKKLKVIFNQFRHVFD